MIREMALTAQAQPPVEMDSAPYGGTPTQQGTMKGSYMRRPDGGPDSPPREMGDCLEAALATILEINSDDVPNFHLFGESWFTELVSFLRPYGWHPLPVMCDRLRSEGPPKGWWIAAVPSRSYGLPVTHALVCHDGSLEWDPSPRADRYTQMPPIEDVIYGISIHRK